VCTAPRIADETSQRHMLAIGTHFGEVPRTLYPYYVPVA